jgi:hypothetical protein
MSHVNAIQDMCERSMLEHTCSVVPNFNLPYNVSFTSTIISTADKPSLNLSSREFT